MVMTILMTFTVVMGTSGLFVVGVALMYRFLSRWLRRRRLQAIADQVVLYAQESFTISDPGTAGTDDGIGTRLHQLLEDMDNDRDYR
jgi:hypothetical protein